MNSVHRNIVSAFFVVDPHQHDDSKSRIGTKTAMVVAAAYIPSPLDDRWREMGDDQPDDNVEAKRLMMFGVLRTRLHKLKKRMSNQPNITLTGSVSVCKNLFRRYENKRLVQLAMLDEDDIDDIVDTSRSTEPIFGVFSSQ